MQLPTQHLIALLPVFLSLTLQGATAYPSGESYADIVKRCQTDVYPTPTGVQCYSKDCGIIDECAGIAAGNSSATAQIPKASNSAAAGTGKTKNDKSARGQVFENNNSGPGSHTNNNDGPGNHVNNNPGTTINNHGTSGNKNSWTDPKANNNNAWKNSNPNNNNDWTDSSANNGNNDGEGGDVFENDNY